MMSLCLVDVMRVWAFMSSVTQMILAYDVLLAVLDNKTLSCLNLLAKDIVDAAVLIPQQER